MASADLNIRTNMEIKDQAESFSGSGLNMTTAINMFLRSTIKENCIPFALKLNAPNAVPITAMDTSEKREDLFRPTNESISVLAEAYNA